MPQVPTLQPNVGLAVGQPRVAPPSASIEGYGGGEAGRGNQLIGLGEALSNIAIQQQAKINQANVMKAQADLQLQLNENARSQLMKLGENALGKPATENSAAIPSASEDFATFSQNALDGALGNMDNDIQRQKLQEWYNTTFPGMLNKVATHQNEQFDTYLRNSLQAKTNVAIDTFAGNVVMGDYDGAMRAFEDANGSLQMGATWQGLDQTSRENATRDLLFGAANAAIDRLIEDNRPQEAYAFTNRIADRLTPNQLSQLRQKMRPAIINSEASVLAQTIFNDPQFKNADGTLNVGKARAEIIKRATTTKNVGGKYSGDDRHQEAYTEAQWVADQLGVPVNVIFSQWGHESADFSSKLSVENNNLAGLTQTEPNGEDNKQPDGTNYYKKYNSLHDFAVDYVNFIKSGYSDAVGSQSIEQYVTALKNGGYFTDDLNNYISGVQSYDSMYSGSVSDGTPVTQVNQDLVNATIAQLNIMEQDYKLEKAQRATAASNAMASAVQNGQVTNYRDATRYAQAIGKQYGLSPQEVLGLQEIGAGGVGYEKRATAEEQTNAYNQAFDALANGMFMNIDQVKLAYPSLDAQHIIQLNNAFFSDKYKWTTDLNKMVVNGILDRSQYYNDPLMKAYMYAYVTDQVKVFVDQNNRQPNFTEIQGIAETGLEQMYLGQHAKGGFFNGLLPANMQFKDVYSAPKMTIGGVNYHVVTNQDTGESEIYGPNGDKLEYDFTFGRFNEYER